MIRLLIVDDEEIIVNGLYEIFNSMKHLDLDVYKAYSGEEAIEWLNRTRIDIVLTDIRMPGIDGMQLLAEIRKSWPQCRVIFLTGYDEFGYIYQAIQHSNVTYILKNEDHEKVIGAVENAIKEIQKGLKIENLIHMAKEQMDMAVDLFQKDYFLHLLHENEFGVSQAQFDKLGVPMRPDYPVVLLLGHVDAIPADLPYWDKINYLYSVRLIIGRYLNSHTVNVGVMDESYRFILFIQPKELLSGNPTGDDSAALYARTSTFLQGTLEVIQSTCRESLRASISFSLAGEPCGWEDLSKKYYSLNQLLNFKIGKGIETLLTDNAFEDKILNAGTPENEADRALIEILHRQRCADAMGQYLESGQRDPYFKCLAELTDPIRAMENKNSGLATEAYYKAAVCILSYTNRWKLGGKVAAQTGQNKLMDIHRHESWAAAADYLYTLSELLFRLQSEEQKKRADTAVDYLQNFIRGHLGEDLSLVRLAEQVYLNPSYLSRLFKQVKGMNLSDYIDNARITMAKELLERETLKIHEVAKMTGYETAASFTRFFRKMTGRSPQEYQDTFLSR